MRISPEHHRVALIRVNAFIRWIWPHVAVQQMAHVSFEATKDQLFVAPFVAYTELSHQKMSGSGQVMILNFNKTICISLINAIVFIVSTLFLFHSFQEHEKNAKDNNDLRRSSVYESFSNIQKNHKFFDLINERNYDKVCQVLAIDLNMQPMFLDDLSNGLPAADIKSINNEKEKVKYIIKNDTCNNKPVSYFLNQR